MREIKFRAWLKKDQKIYKVLHLYWVEDHSYISKPSVLLDDNKVNYPKYKHDDIELMQFTGLKDKNGKEIYEGDILKHSISNYKSEVKWEHAGFGFCDNEGMAILGNEFEVIGNIYENKDLLE